MTRPLTHLIATAVFFLAMGVPASAQPFLDEDAEAFQIPVEKAETLSRVEWNAFGDRISQALNSENEGIRFAAMRAVIQYGSQFEAQRSLTLKLASVYRNHTNDNARRMAVVAIAEAGDPWGIDYLKRSLPYEKSPGVRHTVAAVLLEAGAIGLGPARNSN